MNWLITQCVIFHMADIKLSLSILDISCIKPLTNTAELAHFKGELRHLKLYASTYLYSIYQLLDKSEQTIMICQWRATRYCIFQCRRRRQITGSKTLTNHDILR